MQNQSALLVSYTVPYFSLGSKVSSGSALDTDNSLEAISDESAKHFFTNLSSILITQIYHYYYDQQYKK